MSKSEGVDSLEAQKFRISEHFSPLNAAAGGLAIGTVAASRLMLWGKITGISGILAGIINKPSPVDWAARLAFAGGMVACGSAIEVLFFAKLLFSSFLKCSSVVYDQASHTVATEPMKDMGMIRLAVAGTLVGFGTQLGNGCTSGHGISQCHNPGCVSHSNYCAWPHAPQL